MSVTHEEVLKIAQLAELAVSDEALPELATQMSRILEYVAQINSVSASEGVKPFVPGPDAVRFRADEVKPWPLAFELPAQPEGAADLHVQVSFAYCNEGQGVCVSANPSWRVPVTFDLNGEATAELVASLS